MTNNSKAITELNSNKISFDLTELFSGNIGTNGVPHVDIDLTNYKALYIESEHNAYTYNVFIPKQVLTSERRLYWTTSFFQAEDSNCSIAFGVSLTKIDKAFFKFNATMQDTIIGVKVYGVK